MVENENELIKAVASYATNPLGYLCFNWRWGEPGTPLEKFQGPQQWQADVLGYIGDELQKGNRVRVSLGSGHWTGKTMLLATFTHYRLATQVQPQIIVTANSLPQLSGKTWREVAIWNQRAKNGHWFDWTATKLAMKSDPGAWFAAALAWNKNNPDAFQGAHDTFIFDESAGIDDSIFEVVEGAMPLIWILAGNRTRNTGYFESTLSGSRSRRWKSWVIDSRSTEIAQIVGQLPVIQEWVDDYGEDSDFFRVRCAGLPPKGSFTSYIPQELVDSATDRQIGLAEIESWPRVMGIDVGGGHDHSVIVRRQGPQVFQDIVRLQSKDSLDIADRAMMLATKWDNEANDGQRTKIIIERTGIGDGAYNLMLRAGYDVYGIHPGVKLERTQPWRNIRARCWYLGKEWLKSGSIPAEKHLLTGLMAPKYSYSDTGQLTIESKKDLLARGIDSPDEADAFMMTHAVYFEPIGQRIPTPAARKQPQGPAEIWEQRMKRR